MIRAITFDKQLMKSEDFAHQVNYFYQGKMGVTKGCDISEDSNGNIVVSDGYFSIYGRYLKIEGNEVIEVPDIPSGVLYSILVFEIDLSKENTIDEFNQGRFKIISDAGGYPDLTQEDLDNGGTIYQLEFCRFENTVAGTVNLVDTRVILSLEMYALQENFESHLAESVQDTGGVHGLEYEEGTWSPILFAENGQVDVTLYSTTNSYVRIGNLVFIRGEISIDTYSKGTGAGRIEVAGLPFTPAESATMAVRAHSLTTPNIDIMAAGVGNTIVFTKSPATTTTLFDYIGVDDIKNRSRFYLSGTYRI